MNLPQSVVEDQKQLKYKDLDKIGRRGEIASE